MRHVDLFISIRDSNPRTDWVHVQGPFNHSTTYFKNDVNLRFVTSIDEEHIQQEDFKEVWANKFPDQSATGYFYDLYYGSTLLTRFILVAVDGARALLPLPDWQSKIVNNLNYIVAQIFDGNNTLDEYLRSANLTVSKDIDGL